MHVTVDYSWFWLPELGLQGPNPGSGRSLTNTVQQPPYFYSKKSLEYSFKPR